MFKLPELPYAKDALEPHISSKTMEFHYGKHHKGYVDNLNKLVKGTLFEGQDLEDVIKNASGTIYNNAAQVWNHTFFWNCLTPDSQELDEDSDLGQAINQSFGSFDKFKEKFAEAATKLFGSGWIWLIYDDDDLSGKPLLIHKMKDAGEPLSKELGTPILVCDVWEHAYYLDYQNDRGKFVEKAFFSLVNWDFAQENFDRVK